MPSNTIGSTALVHQATDCITELVAVGIFGVPSKFLAPSKALPEGIEPTAVRLKFYIVLPLFISVVVLFCLFNEN